MFRFTSKPIKIPIIEDNQPTCESVASTPAEGTAVFVDAPDLLDDDAPSEEHIRSNRVFFSDDALEYDNITCTEQQEDDDGFSLHTTESQDSIDLQELIRQRNAASDIPSIDTAPAAALSLHASQVDMSKIIGFDSIPSDSSKAPSVSSNMIGDGNDVDNKSSTEYQSGNDSTTDETSAALPKYKRSSILCYKMIAMVAILVVVIVRGLSPFFCEPNGDDFPIREEAEEASSASTKFQGMHNHTQIGASSEEPKVASIQVHYIPSMVQEQTSVDSICGAGNGFWFCCVFGIVSIFLTTSRSKPSAAKPPTPQNETNHDPNKPNTNNKLDVWKGWDLSRYEEMKVDELRRLLSERQCKTFGRKQVLTRRLVAIRTAEVENLTVRQIRPMLKTRGCKQGGLKVELIQRLVEAGL